MEINNKVVRTCVEVGKQKCNKTINGMECQPERKKRRAGPMVEGWSGRGLEK